MPEEVKKALLQLLGRGEATDEVEVASLRKEFAGIHKSVRFGLPMCRITANRQLDTCFSWWLPGHTARTCKGPDRSKACRNRGKESASCVDRKATCRLRPDVACIERLSIKRQVTELRGRR